MDLQNTVLHQKDYKSGIVPFENLTAPDASGLEVCVHCKAFLLLLFFHEINKIVGNSV